MRSAIEAGGRVFQILGSILCIVFSRVLLPRVHLPPNRSELLGFRL